MDKRDQDILNQVRKKTADVEVPKSLEPDNIRRMLEEKEKADSGKGRKRRWGIRQTSALAAACLVVVVGFVAWDAAESGGGKFGMTDKKTLSGGGSADRIEISDSKTIAQAESYEQIFEIGRASCRERV